MKARLFLDLSKSSAGAGGIDLDEGVNPVLLAGLSHTVGGDLSREGKWFDRIGVFCHRRDPVQELISRRVGANISSSRGSSVGRRTLRPLGGGARGGLPGFDPFHERRGPPRTHLGALATARKVRSRRNWTGAWTMMLRLPETCP